MDIDLKNKNGESILELLHKINFGSDGIIKTGVKNPPYDEGFFSNAECCRLCNFDKITNMKDESGYTFTNVSHGAHILDYANAGDGVCTDDLKAVNPVIFVMENPSVNKRSGNKYGWLHNQDRAAEDKYPPNCWFWSVGSQKERYVYPEALRQKYYSAMFLSLANTFGLKNAYLTNMVKCGMGCKATENKRETALNTDNYNPQIKETCIRERLAKEIAALRYEPEERVIVLAFGTRVYWNINEYKDECGLGNIDLRLLPHPANHNINDNFRKHVLLGEICQALIKNNVEFNAEKVKELFIRDAKEQQF